MNQHPANSNLDPNSGRLIVVAGASRSGKSHMVNDAVSKSDRCLAYDPKCHPNDYQGLRPIEDIESLALILAEVGDGPAKFRFMDERKQDFDLFCEVALAWAKEHGGLTVVIDELAEVTSPGKAPGAWGALVRTGLGFKINIFAITQSPVESDKSCLRNASGFISFHMEHPRDRAYMAEYLMVDPDVLGSLKLYTCISKMRGEKPELLDTTTGKRTTI